MPMVMMRVKSISLYSNDHRPLPNMAVHGALSLVLFFGSWGILCYEQQTINDNDN